MSLLRATVGRLRPRRPEFLDGAQVLEIGGVLLLAAAASFLHVAVSLFVLSVYALLAANAGNR